MCTSPSTAPGSSDAIVFEQMRRRFGKRLSQKGSGSGVMVEQRSHFLAYSSVIWRGLLEPLHHVCRLVIECRFEQIARAFALLRSHFFVAGAPPAAARGFTD